MPRKSRADNRLLKGLLRGEKGDNLGIRVSLGKGIGKIVQPRSDENRRGDGAGTDFPVEEPAGLLSGVEAGVQTTVCGSVVLNG